jgi:hypothetical protein
VAEWTVRVGKAKLVRTAALLRGRSLAILADQWEGADDSGETRFELADKVEVSSIPECRAVRLRSGKSRVSAQVCPIGLPCASYASERGSFGRDGKWLRLQQPAAGRRVWRPILVSWEPSRNRLPVRWRTLTVTEQSRTCDSSVAFGARVSWGRDETLLIYRSLGKPALRAVLGYQTRARFVVGLFGRDGDVEPIVTIEEP